MRIERLELRAFGCYSNTALHFDSAENGLHFVYGNNEAGKSTALRAIQCWLYGFEKEDKKYAFLHDAGDLRVGGLVSLEDSRVFSMRKYGIKNTLLKEDEAPFSHDPLGDILQGIDRSRFGGIFGVNRDQLVAGGKEIAEGQGDLGAALFASAAGLLGLQKLRSKIEAAKKALYSPTGKKTINEALTALKKAKTRIKEEAVSSKDYEELTTQLEQKTRAVRNLRDEQRQLLADKERWLNINRARPVAQRSSELSLKLESWSSVPRLDSEFSTRYQSAIQRIATVESLAKAVEAETCTLRNDIAAIPNLNPVLDWEDRIEKIHQWSTTESAKRKERTDASQKARDASGEAKQALRKLGYADIENFEGYLEKLRVDDLTLTKIAKLGKQYEKLSTARANSNRDHTDKLNEASSLSARMAELPVVRNTGVLSALLDRFHADGNPEKACVDLESEVNQLTAKLATELDKLGLTIAVDEIITTRVPNHDAIETYRKRLDDCERNLKDAKKRQTDLRQARIVLEREIADLQGGEQIPDIDSLGRARAKRETGWSIIRSVWLVADAPAVEIAAYTGRGNEAEDLAAVYEDHVANCDNVGDRLRLEAKRVADLNRLQNEQAANTKSQAEAGLANDQAQADLSKVQQDWILLWNPTGLTAKSPHEMRSWLDGWNSAGLQAEQLRQKLTALSLQRKNVATEFRLVRQVLNDVGEMNGQSAAIERLADLLTLGRSCLQSEQTRQNERKRLESEHNRVGIEVKKLGIKLEQSEREWTEWWGKWRDLMSLIDRAAETLPDEADEVLKLIADYQKQMKFRREQLQVEERLQRDETEQLEEVRFLAKKLGSSVDGALGAHMLLIAEWKRLLKQAVYERTLKTSKEQSLQEKEDILAEHNAELTGLRRKLDLLRAEAKVQSNEEVPARIEESRDRDRAEKDLLVNEKELTELAVAEPRDKFLAEVEQYREHNLQEQVATIEGRLNELADLIPQQAKEQGETQNKLDHLQSRRGAIEARTELESSLATLRDRCPDYVALFLAEEVLKMAIARFAEKSKTDVFGIASDRFSQLTCGSFERLEISDDDGTPILIGRRPASAGGKSVRVTGMSDGTCDQLYLALRLAHLQKHVEREGSFPFIVDDILITFDNDRALAALRCLCELSAKTQIFFFSHHRHLVDLARNNLPSEKVFFHKLDATS